MLKSLSILNLETFNSSGAQFGHRVAEWRPSTLGSTNFLSKRNEFLIFNLKNTMNFLQRAYLFFKQMSYKGAVVLYIDGSKLKSGIGNSVIKNAALFTNISYVTSLWAGGTLTNFREVIYKVSRKSKNLRPVRNKTIRYMSGVYRLDFIPEVIVSSSEFYSPFSVAEANLLYIPSIAISDSNLISLESTYSVLCNDDSVLTIKYVFFVLNSSYWFGKADFAMKYSKVANTFLKRFIVSFGFLKFKKYSLKKWLKSTRNRFSSSLILNLLTVVGLEPTFSFTRSGF